MLRFGRGQISFADYQLANIIYKCAENCSTSLACANGGYQGPDCNCVCPPGYSGTLCQKEKGSKDPPLGICSGKFTADKGEITSPNFPSNYNNSMECYYLIEVM